MFFKGTELSEIYPTDKKSDAGHALKTFVMDLGFPEELDINESKEQNSSGTEFIIFFGRMISQ